MPLHWNSMRFYKGTVGVSHGILVLLLRHTKVFWKAYRDLLRINGKEESDSKELRKMMQQIPKLKPRRQIITVKKKERLIKRIKEEFNQGLADLDDMHTSLDSLEREDETLLFRAMTDLSILYDKFFYMEHMALPEHMQQDVLNAMYSLMAHIDQLQHHTWVVSKAHARGHSKIREIVPVTSRREWRRLRRNTLELNHVLNRIGPLKVWILKIRYIENDDELKKLHHRTVEMLELYHDEIENIHHILQEAHVLTRRTEKLFNRIEQEAHTLGDSELKELVHKYAEKFHDIHKNFESMARKESLDIHILFKHADAPAKRMKVTRPQMRAAA